MFKKYQKLKISRERSYDSLLVSYIGQYIGMEKQSPESDKYVSVTKFLVQPLEEKNYYKNIISINPYDIEEIIDEI